ncbi:GreA/GreB family elongation factor [uncultured Sphingopyxis sp.]|uniref:GreA/GreB family elongation factor n=2 Tax=uncultured Sphingopyxis sp. TaxID=310581 RepID=A0A1Y5PRT3_9SPHN|nr:GreA/GreB family elongation factor [uncultured Sphingopyxis sp.]
MIDSEAECLSNLALAVEERLPDVSELLLGEISRAVLHKRERMPVDTVTMHSHIGFADEASDREYRCQLVFPKDADIAENRISILTPVGAGLIGLKPGQSILWPDREGRKRTLTVRTVERAD